MHVQLQQEVGSCNAVWQCTERRGSQGAGPTSVYSAVLVLGPQMPSTCMQQMYLSPLLMQNSADCEMLPATNMALNITLHQDACFATCCGPSDELLHALRPAVVFRCCAAA